MIKALMVSPGVKPQIAPLVDNREFLDAMKDVVNVSVEFGSNYYSVSPSPSKGAAIAIGRAICKSGLGKCCVQIPKLFSSVEVCVDEEEKNDRKEKNRVDRHT